MGRRALTRRSLLAAFGPAVLLACTPGFRGAEAQQRVAPFGTVSLSLAATANVNRTGFHEFWEPDVGVEVAAAAPFYAGAVELGVERMSFDGADAVPDYRGWFVYVGWGTGLNLVRQVRWEPGVRIGSYAMRFSGADVPEDRRSESELGTEIVSRLAWRFAPAWDLLLAGRYRVVFTEPEIRHAFAVLGARRTFSAPQWLRDFLD